MLSLLVPFALAPVDQDYLKTVAEDNIAELQMVKMVVNKTHNPAVRRACEVMIRDHSQQLAQVRGLGERYDVDLPTEPSVKHQALYENMVKKTGRDLDKSFTAAQLEDHIKDVNEAHDEVEIGREATLRDFAKKAVITFARHEEIWRGVAKTVGVPSTFGRPTAKEILNGKKIAG